MVIWPSNLITFQVSFYLCLDVSFNRCTFSIGLSGLHFLCNYFVGADSNSSGVKYSQGMDGCSCLDSYKERDPGISLHPDLAVFWVTPLANIGQAS